VHSDKTGRAGDENLHDRSLAPGLRFGRIPFSARFSRPRRFAEANVRGAIRMALPRAAVPQQSVQHPERAGVTIARSTRLRRLSSVRSNAIRSECLGKGSALDVR
jgi:hypothetical protein